MLKRCPVCRGRRLDDNTCGRCGADLFPLLEIERDADIACARAITALADNNHLLAKRCALAALCKRKTPFRQTLAAFLETLPT